VAPPAPAENGVKEERRSGTPFERVAALDGRVRCLKVLMLPSTAMNQGARADFRVARLGYNQTNALIKGGAQKNQIKLRNEVLAKPQPRDPSGVSLEGRSLHQESAVSRCVDAPTPAQRSQTEEEGCTQVRRPHRSLRKLRETISMQKVNDNNLAKKRHTLLRFEAQPPLANRKGRAGVLCFF